MGVSVLISVYWSFVTFKLIAKVTPSDNDTVLSFSITFIFCYVNPIIYPTLKLVIFSFLNCCWVERNKRSAVVGLSMHLAKS